MFGRQGIKNSGIIPRCINDIFTIAQKDRSHITSYNVYVSFMQVYNEQVYDLFGDAHSHQPLSIHESLPQQCGGGGTKLKNSHGSKNCFPMKQKPCSIIVAGLSELKVRNIRECMALLQLGLKNRSVRETSMNNASSRSHSIFQILVEQVRKEVDKMNPNIAISASKAISSKLSLVDLAGSERWNMYRDSHIEDTQIMELTNINSSLHTLGRCMAALVKQQKDYEVILKRREYSRSVIHIPYRDSKLTRLLQDSLGGNATTILLATINPSLTCIEETISTLRFADRSGQVLTQAQLNEERIVQPKEEQVASLQKEITRLQDLLKHHGINYENLQLTAKNMNKSIARQIIRTDIYEETDKQNMNTVVKVSPSMGHLIEPSFSCERMVKAVSDVVHCCEIFLNTAATLNSTTPPAHRETPIKDPYKAIETSVIPKTVVIETKVSRDAKNRDVNTADTSKSRLSQLLIRRQQLTRSASATRNDVVSPATSPTINGNYKREEERIRTELKEAHERKHKKTQLCAWLTEKKAHGKNINHLPTDFVGEESHSKNLPTTSSRSIKTPTTTGKRGKSLEAYYHVVQQQLDELNESSQMSQISESDER